MTGDYIIELRSAALARAKDAWRNAGIADYPLATERLVAARAVYRSEYRGADGELPSLTVSGTVLGSRYLPDWRKRPNPSPSHYYERKA